ncbi:FAD-linked oxidoreductase [Lentinula aciculospora]|uniref:Proline dehydrogenase n=1 Tax=Lentinula aciculospora TaxID=153920 RepID=A0A9W9DGI2_9AGAR|nr:FAD-linked oxidoreductase [Lentinula aciculospora]
MLVRRATKHISPHAFPSISQPNRHIHRAGGSLQRLLHRSAPSKLLYGGILVGSLGLGYFTLHGRNDDRHATKTQTPLSTLLRSYCVFAMCSIPSLVDKSPAILDVLTSIPGVKQITYAFVRYTFFDQFVGGDTSQDCVPLLERLCAENKSGVLTYSVEVGQASTTDQEARARAKHVVKQTIQSIDVVASTVDEQPLTKGNGSLWIAIKLTGMIPRSQTLINLSAHLRNIRKSSSSPRISYPGCPTPSDLDFLTEGTSLTGSPLTDQDVLDLCELHADLVQICMHCKKRGVKILIDAEHSWFEPAIDTMGLSLMRKFNSLSDIAASPVPLVYVTFQAYLRRNKDYLIQSLKDAEAGNFALGVKLVRGAYQAIEIQEHEKAASNSSAPSLSVSPEPQPPTWSTKLETDQCYNDCIRILISALHKDVESHSPYPRIGIMFGTHNSDSCELILEETVRQGLAKREGDVHGVIAIPPEVTDRMSIAQLYGMSDSLSGSLVARTKTDAPLVAKFVPYGALAEVMPYLSRRAVENKAVLGQGKAVAERKRAGEEIWHFFRG